MENLIRDRKPEVVIKALSGNEIEKIDMNTLKVTLDDIAVSRRKLKDNLYAIDYGKTLYPGIHRLRFFFRNMRRQSSMVQSAVFTVEIKSGDHDRLIKEGKRLIRRKRTAKEGLKMLVSALSMGYTDPNDDRLIHDIARGFRIVGDYASAEYYLKKLYFFYPESSYGKSLKRHVYSSNSYRFPVEYHGKPVPVFGETCPINSSKARGKKDPDMNLRSFWSRFFDRQ